MVLWLEPYLAKQQDTVKTLQFAPDYGVKNWLRNNSKVDLTTTDYSAPHVDYHWDITDLPVESETYDLVICSHVMEHIPDDAKAFSELHRILKKGGVLLLQVPYAPDQPQTDEDDSVTDPEERVRRFGQFDHVRLYGQDIVDRIQAQNLQCTVIKIDRWIEPEKIKRFGMRVGLRDNEIFECRRSE